MSENLDPKDKIILDTTDSDEISDHFSRLSPGDEVSGTFKATLDEAGQKLVTMSIKEISIEDAAAVTMEKAGEEGGEEPAAVTVTKNENGTPAQDGADEVPEPLFR
jgi:hypothetical protein